MRDADGRGVLLDVLAAVTARAVDVDAKVVGVHLHLRRVAGFGQHLDESERRVARVGGVEGRKTHQTMHAAFAPQVAERVRAGDLDRGALDAGLFAGHQVDDVRSEAALLAPAQVHAHEHLRPVLRLRAAGAGVDGDDGVPVVIRARERELELQIVELALDIGRVTFDIRGSGFVLFWFGEIEQLQKLADARFEAAPGFDTRADGGEATHRILSRLLVRPEVARASLRLQRGSFGF